MKIGIDFGGHTIIAALISTGEEPPRIERRTQRDTPSGRSVAAVVEMLADAIEELAYGASRTAVDFVGVAVPGMLDAGRRSARKMANFPVEWDGVDIPATLAGELQKRNLNPAVRIENDANCYALGEGSAGVAVGLRDYVVLTMGTGIGCGIVLGGRLLTGSHGMAGEAGHIVVDGSAPCGCGGMGHAETLAAADGTSCRARAAGLPEDFAVLWRMRGDAGADAVLDVTLDAMARTIAGVSHTLDPEMIVIGGGMSRAQGLLEALRLRTLPYLSRPFRDVLNLQISSLGNDAALYGAVRI